MKTDFTNSGSISFLNPDFSGMSRDNEGNFVVAKDPGEAMRSNPNMFGPNGAQVDTFGGEDIDIRKARVQDDSRMQGPSSSTIQNNVLVNPTNLTKDPAFDQAYKNMLAKQAQLTNMSLPTGINTATPNTLNLLSNSGSQNNVTPANLQQTLNAFQQLQGGNNQQPNNTTTLSNPINVAGVLGNTGANSSSATNLPLGNQGGGTTANNNYTRVSNSSKQHGSANTTTSQNYSTSLTGGGYEAEGILGTTTRLDQRTNMIDPVQKNMDDLNTLAILGSTNFQGEVQPANNIDLLNKNKKEAYLTSLNEQMSKEGTFETQEREKFKVKKNDVNIALREGVMNAAGVTTINSGNTKVDTGSKGGKLDPNMEATKMSWLGSEQDPTTGEWSQLTTTKDGRFFIGNTTSAGKVFATWDSGDKALSVLKDRISNLPYDVKEERGDGGNSKFVGYDENGKPAGAIAWDKERRKWRVIGYDGGSTAVMLHLSGMIQNGFDMKELNQRSAEINVRTND
ncbi:MAG: hypothetical protein H6615_07805 [Ignavibacteria bacterium]|nr:hypothetical protein [Ignavibacteria bacterium]